MAGTKFDIEKFDGNGDFSLWKRQMYAFLSVSGLKDVLIEKTKIEDETDEDEKDPEKKKKIVEAEIARSERCEKAVNNIFLNVGDHVLRKIERCTTAAEAWALLEKLYMPKSLPNHVHAQLRLYSFKMQENRTVDDNIDEFLKIIGDLSNLSIEVPEEVKAILLLNSLPSRYDQLKETLKYGRDVIKVDEVASSARSKEKELKDVIGLRAVQRGTLLEEGLKTEVLIMVMGRRRTSGLDQSQQIERKSAGFVEKKVTTSNATSGSRGTSIDISQIEVNLRW